MRYITKTAIASLGVAAAVFVTTYAVKFSWWREYSRQQREWLLRGEEALNRGEIWLYCGPTPFQRAAIFGFYALVAAPIVLLTAGGIWRLCARHKSDKTHVA